jgi:hypothetical protein
MVPLPPPSPPLPPFNLGDLTYSNTQSEPLIVFYGGLYLKGPSHHILKGLTTEWA